MSMAGPTKDLSEERETVTSLARIAGVAASTASRPERRPARRGSGRGTRPHASAIVGNAALPDEVAQLCGELMIRRSARPPP